MTYRKNGKKIVKDKQGFTVVSLRNMENWNGFSDDITTL